ncbi:MAG TPA: ribosome biogenesis GTP-binding protein YihA/YsxC [Steroidobacteraceae bacterium]|nr:ribosome biogenesis GTP-binding protein YihA/YsxC [Steroidobacteraceae bacterium]
MSQFPNVRFLLSAASEEQFPHDSGAEVAFAGRSNSGKSSAINAIMVRNGLARASKTPGRTRLLNFFEVEEGRRILDLPGYGYAEASPVEKAQWIGLIERLPARGCIRGLFLIVDIRRGLKEGDEQLLDWAHASDWAVHVLLTKADKLNQRERAATLKDTEDRIADGMTAQVFSATDKIGVPAAQKRLEQMLRQPADGAP